MKRRNFLRSVILGVPTLALPLPIIAATPASEAFSFPQARRVFASTIAKDLVPVQPMKPADYLNILDHIDFIILKEDSLTDLERYEKLRSWI